MTTSSNPATTRTVPDLTAVAGLLSNHPEFGDGAAIEERALARFQVGLATLRRRFPRYQALADALVGADSGVLRMALRDPVTRNAFETGLQIARGNAPDEDDPLLAELVTDEPGGRGPTQRATGQRHRLWPGLSDAWLWEPAVVSSPVVARLRKLTRAAFTSPTAGAPIAVGEPELAGLRRGAMLLRELLPGVSETVMRHVGMVGLARDTAPDGALHSLSGGDGLPATLFIGPQKTADPWEAAGTIMHEGLHLTLFEIIRCGGLVAGDPTRLPEVPIPWRVRAWSITRALFALHVYVHAAYFSVAVGHADSGILDRYGSPPAAGTVSPTSQGRAGYDTPLLRAAYLAEYLDRTIPHTLTGYGRQFVGWLVAALELLSPGLSDGWPPADRVTTSPTGEHAPTTPGAERADTAPDGDQPAVPAVAKLRTVRPVDALPLPGQRRLVLAGSDQRVHWLNLDSWTIYALCDGASYEDVATRYAAAVNHVTDAWQARRRLHAGLRQLIDAELVTAEV